MRNMSDTKVVSCRVCVSVSACGLPTDLHHLLSGQLQNHLLFAEAFRFGRLLHHSLGVSFGFLVFLSAQIVHSVR